MARPSRRRAPAKTRRPASAALPALDPLNFPRPTEPPPPPPAAPPSAPQPGMLGRAVLFGSRRSTLLAAAFAIVGLWGAAVLFAAWRAALTGISMPDMSAGLAPMAAVIVPALGAMITHHRETLFSLPGVSPGRDA